MGWASAGIVSNIFHIIVTEVMGVNATLESTGPTVIDAIYALAGCTTPTQIDNRGCPQTAPEYPDHAVVLEVWYLDGWYEVVQDDVPGFEADILGSIGYPGTEIIGGSQTVQLEAYQRSGIPLEYFKSYNVSWMQPWQFFPNISAVNSSRLMPCSESDISDTVMATAHLEFTNDTGGVVEDAEGILKLRCWDGVWWLAPSCRQSPETCIPVITGGNGWAIDAIAMWAAVYNMPLALGVGLTHEDHASIPATTGCMLYTWEPDATFVDMRPFSVTFPRNNPVAWGKLDKRTGPPVITLYKLASRGLSTQSPVIHRLAQNMLLSKEEIDELLITWKFDARASRDFDVACDWIKSNEEVWGAWIPETTACIPTMGMVDIARRPVLNRAEATSCDWCPAGMYSDKVKDSEGVTHVCRLCSSGKRQSLPGQLACENCSSGTYADAEGTIHCSRCQPGEFAAEVGQQSCQSCAPGMVSTKEGATECIQCAAGTAQAFAGRTACERCPQAFFQWESGAEQCISCNEVLLDSTSAWGAIKASECYCRAGTFRQPRSVEGPKCEQCADHQGLDCPGGNGPPLQEAGYWVQVVDTDVREYSVFLCRSASQCPNGPLGTCAEGRQGKACNSCTSGYYPVSDGWCEECTGSSALTLVGMLVLGPVIVIALVLFLKVDATTQQLTTLTTVATAGQVFTALQALGSLHQLEVNLVHPAKFLLSMAGLLALDLNFLRVPCFFQRDDPIAQFALKLAVLPSLAALLGSIWLIARLVKRPIESAVVFNAMGMFATVFFISITLAVLLPLQCRRNPNGRLSMLSEPGIECFQSQMHMTLAILALLGVLAFPVAILSWAVRATLRYPSLVRSERGLEELRNQRFFFSRFKTDRHYFAMVLFIRNTLVPLIPIVLVGSPALQCSAMGLVLLVVFGLEATLWPWRTHHANVSALFLDALLIMAVVSIGPTIDASTGGSLKAISWYVACCAFGILGTALCFLILSIYRRLRRVRLYGAFLCHHKAGAGVLARQMKMLLQIRCRSSIFLDSDELDDLERLFDIVRCDTDNLVILLSGDVLSRVWCAGEIATACRNGIRTVAVAFDLYTLPDGEQIEAITQGWTEEERHTLFAFDITTSMVADAYRNLATIHPVSASRSAGTVKKGAAVQELISRCRLPTRRFTGSTAELPVKAHSEAPIFILGATGNMEVLAACEVLQMMLQQALQVVVKVIHNAQEISGIASAVVVVLTVGLLEDVAFAKTVLAVHGIESLSASHFVSVLADNYFQFPTVEVYSKLETSGLPALGAEVGPQLVEAYTELFSTIALPYSPLASEAVLKLEVSELCRRRLNTLVAQSRTARSRSIPVSEGSPRMHKRSSSESLRTQPTSKWEHLTEESEAVDGWSI